MSSVTFCTTDAGKIFFFHAISECSMTHHMFTKLSCQCTVIIITRISGTNYTVNHAVSRNPALTPNIGLSAIYSCKYPFYNSHWVSLQQSQNVLTNRRIVNLSLFNCRYRAYPIWGLERTARLISIIVAVLFFKSCRNFRPILRITFTQTCFHIATRRFSLFVDQRPIFGAGAVFCDTLKPQQQAVVLLSMGTGYSRIYITAVKLLPVNGGPKFNYHVYP